MMTSTLNANVTYLMLQRLAERAWDNGEMENLLAFSKAVDSLCVDLLARGKERQQAV